MIKKEKKGVGIVTRLQRGRELPPKAPPYNSEETEYDDSPRVGLVC